MNWRTDEEQAETDSGRRISLPEPDVENITVLTKSLPNEPILPWHHFDSPWLERDDEAQEEETEVSEPEASEPKTTNAADAEAASIEPALETALENSASPASPTADAATSEEVADSQDLEQLALALDVPEATPEASASETSAPKALSEPAPIADALPEHSEA